MTVKVRKMWKRLTEGQGGFILPIVLALFGLGVLLIAPALGQSFTGLQANIVTETKSDELHSADAGVEDAVHWLMQGEDADGRYSSSGEDQWSRVASIPLNDTSVSVLIEEVGPYHRIESTSTSASGDTTVEAFVLVTMDEGIASAPSPFDYSVVTLDGDLVVTGSSGIDSLPPAVPGDPSTYGASVWVNGNINLGWSTNIWGDAKATGTADRPNNIKGTYTPGADPPARPVWLDERIEEYIASTVVVDPFEPNVVSNGTGHVSGAPYTLSYGTQTLTVTSAGTIAVSVAAAGTVSVRSGTATVTSSPVNLTAGEHTVTVQNSGTIVIEVGGNQPPNPILGWGTHGTYEAMQVTGNLSITGSSGGGIYTFTGPVCVGGNLTISSGVNHIIFQGPVKVGGYVNLEGNGTVIFEDVLYIDGYLKAAGSRSCKFMDQVAIEGNLRTSSRILDMGGSKHSGADYDIVFESTIRATEPTPSTCYAIRFGSGRAYTFNGPVYTTEKAELAGNAGCEMTFTNGLIADCDVTVSGSSRTNAPPENSPLLVSRYGGVSLTGNVPVDAIVYCPEGRGYMSGSSVLHGAMVARNAELSGNVRLKYPVLLAERGDLHEGGGGEGTGAAGITIVSYSVS